MVELLGFRTGDQVLDIGCGTGMNFPLVQDRVGPGGIIVGVDRSAQMLAQARRRAVRHGWENVILIQADATAFSAEQISVEVTRDGGRPFSEVTLATYALSLMQQWENAWETMQQLTVTRGRLGVLDMQRPTGPSALLTPLARTACWLGGADIDAHPWKALERDSAEVRSASARGGHLQVRVGSKPR
ncbi:class I SAM-dependent methyltransferase [Nesterenkonia aurantiaca]|uniref:class I SAM-dependent methyltransferase n=1 Tax=Nesterenkonia aurantiaca TaxID=1436010 RepID=UPI0024448A7B|nr:methyltransferase domain-containing protein [Nesterenkonia aurantiaca]